ncbi:RYamide receptor-like [Arctopsyche grandis]|uniref:RYamide receptor-like n=1 Tax=Arctopsyche grandis TaxID=121162 RepID=UPI00406D9E51
MFKIYIAVDDLYQPTTGLIIFLSSLYALISLLAVIGNGMIIWIICSTKNMRTLTNNYIANLAIADIIIGLFSIPFQFQAALLQRWQLPEIMCPLCPFFQTVSVNVSIFTLTAIAIDRHKAILYPMSVRPSKRVVRIIITAIWFLGVLLAIPMLYALRVTKVFDYVDEETNQVQLKPFCDLVNLTPKSMTVYRTVLFLVQYAVPVFLISQKYYSLATTLWGSRVPGNAQESRDANVIQNKKKVIKMLVIVVAIFIICWLPLQFYNILQMFLPQINNFKYINLIFFACDWLAMSNSCYNPFIYGLYNENFKSQFKKRFSICGRKNNAPIADNLNKNKPSTRLRRQSTREMFPLVGINYKNRYQSTFDHQKNRLSTYKETEFSSDGPSKSEISNTFHLSADSFNDSVMEELIDSMMRLSITETTLLSNDDLSSSSSEDSYKND